jgi:phenylpyruvate tautomerase PptA (4-oxalocrotonate tautomerase family)
MPMIDLTMPAGALSDEALDSLSDTLMRALLRAEQVSEDVATKELLSWFFVREIPPRRMYGGAQPVNGRPLFRIDVSVPEDVLDTERKDRFVAEATDLILAAAGLDRDDAGNKARVWVIFREVPDGSWGGGGRILSLRQIARIVGVADDRLANAM